VTDQPRITTTPDPDNAMLHIPEFTYWDTQAWACELGVPVRLLPGLRDAIDKHLSGHASERPEPSPASDDGLRTQYAAAIVRGGGCVDLAAATDAVMAVRDRRLEQLTAGRATWKAKAAEIEAHRDRLLAEFPWLCASDEDRQAAETALAEDIDDWCDKPPTEAPASCSATLRMFETVIHCTHHRPGVHRGPLPNTTSTHAWGDYAAGATPHNPDDTKEAGQ
jgi:hypothetical protein